MKTTLIQIGNSRGVRLPKAVIEQANLGAELDLDVVDGAVVIRAAQAPRTGWAEAVATCHEAEDDLVSDWGVTTPSFMRKPREALRDMAGQPGPGRRE